MDEEKLKATVLKNLDKTKALENLPPLAAVSGMADCVTSSFTEFKR